MSGICICIRHDRMRQLYSAYGPRRVPYDMCHAFRSKELADMTLELCIECDPLNA